MSNGSVVNKLNSIKINLGLNTSQIAECFDVTRTTIYIWLEGEESSVPLWKLDRLYNLSQIWEQNSKISALKYLKNNVGEGKDLLTLLKSEIYDDSVKNVIETLAKQAQSAENEHRKELARWATPPETSEDRILRKTKAIYL